MKPPYTPRELVLAMALFFLLGSFVAMWRHERQLRRCLDVYEQLFDNNEIYVKPK